MGIGFWLVDGGVGGGDYDIGFGLACVVVMVWFWGLDWIGYSGTIDKGIWGGGNGKMDLMRLRVREVMMMVGSNLVNFFFCSLSHSPTSPQITPSFIHPSRPPRPTLYHTLYYQSTISIDNHTAIPTTPHPRKITPQ